MLDLVSGAQVAVSNPGPPTVTVAAPAAPTVHVVPVAGPPGPAGGFVHTQATPAASATIDHPLGRLPNVAIYVGGVEVETDVSATNSTVTVVFPAPTAFVLVLT